MDGNPGGGARGAGTMSRLRKLWSGRAAWGPWALMVSFLGWKTSDIWRQLRSAHFAMPVDIHVPSPCEYVDTLHTYWFTWWVSQWVWHSEPSLMWSDRINLPLGGNSALDYSLAIVHIGLAGLIEPLVGPSAALNLVVMLGVLATLVALYFVIRAISGNGLLAAALSILVVTYGLARGNCLLDLELAFLVYLVLALYAWNRYVLEGSRRWLVVAGFLVGFASFAHAYYGIAVLSFLAAGALLSFGGVTFHGTEGDRTFRRTLLVMALGIGLAGLFHLRNLVATLGQDGKRARDEVLSTGWPFTVLDGALVVGSVLLPALIGWLRKVPNAIMWGLMGLPVAVITLGFSLYVGGQGPLVDMPLLWAREHLPLLWRLTMPQRFVAPLLVGLAFSYAALWRGFLDSGGLSGKWSAVKRLAAGSAFVGVFWVTAAFVPLTPDTSIIDLGPPPGLLPGPGPDGPGPEQPGPGPGLPGGEGPPPGLAGPGAFGGPPSVQPGAVAPPVGMLTPEAKAIGPGGSMIGKLSSRMLLWPFERIEMLPLPAVPECIQALSGEEGRFGILELTLDPHMGGCKAYFQTAHGKAVAGFPCLTNVMAGLHNQISELTALQQQFRAGELERLPDRDWLREQGVRYVVLYSGPDQAGGDELVPSFGGRPPQTSTSDQGPDFDAAYGPPVCSDGFTRVYGVGGP